MLLIERFDFAAVLAAGLAVAGAASATEYCVACTAPDAVYRCAIEGETASGPADPVSQILCIKKLAEEGGHERCSIERFSKEGCAGPLKTVVRGSGIEGVPGLSAGGKPDGDPPAGASGATAPQEATQPETQVGDKPADDKPPQTMEELAKQTVSSTKEDLDQAGSAVSDGAKKAGDQIEGAGSAIANAAKKSWTCMVSLFSDC